ncbi:MAG TPA: type II toxin-antitoxin system VapC family toxin [Nitrospiraceae bacterium]|nr:type II toxin-antitoxin system VapC family toxin [Nitrospiraceae bacterium]
MPYLLDSDWAMQALAGHAEVNATIKRLRPEGISISWLAVGEIYEGAFDKPDPQAALTTYRRFLQPFPILGLNDPIMERFAEVRAELRRRGQIIPDLDLLAAATALHHDLTVLTSDKHFQRVPGLKVHREQ